MLRCRSSRLSRLLQKMPSLRDSQIIQPALPGIGIPAFKYRRVATNTLRRASWFSIADAMAVYSLGREPQENANEVPVVSKRRQKIC